MNTRVRMLVEMALAIALAAVLNTLKVWQMPQGGSISLGMLPIFIVALRHGLLLGLLAGAAYGFVDFVVNPYPPVHWAQLLLDYPIAYAGVGLAGIGATARAKAVAAGSHGLAWGVVVISLVVGAAARYASHVISGIVYFGSFAPEGQPVWLYSVIYNTYVPISAAACLAAAAVVLPALDRARGATPSATAG